jgi:hypothetical protein
MVSRMMNTDELQKCIECLNEIAEKYSLQVSIQIQCGKENLVIVFVEGLQSMSFDDCGCLLKCRDLLIQCIQVKSEIINSNDELTKLMMSMRD